MTQRSILEYAQALRSRYFWASRTEKGKMLDEFTKVMGLHRQAAIRLLGRPGQPRTGQRRGRLRQFLKQINSHLEQLWRLAQHPASLGNRYSDANRRPSVTV